MSTRTVSNVDEKKARIRAERRQRLINQGTPADKVDEVMAQEDWERLPIEKRVQLMIEGSLQNIAKDVIGLHHNDQLLAASMDVNFRAITKALKKLGVTSEDILGFMKEAQEEAVAEIKAKQEREPTKQEDVEGIAEQPGTPAAPPEEATVFGG